MNKILKKTSNLLKKNKTNSSSELYEADDSTSSFGRSVLNFFQQTEWDHLLDHLFSVSSRPFIHKTFVITLICSTAYIGGKIAAIVTQKRMDTSLMTRNPAPSDNFSLKKYSKVLSQVEKDNLFNAKNSLISKTKTAKKKEVISEMKCDQSNSKSSIPLKLLSTTVLQNYKKSSFSVEHKKDQHTLYEGDRIGDFAEIGRISRQKVVFRNLKNGKCEYITNIDEKLNKTFAKDFSSKAKILSPSQGKKLLPKNISNNIKNQGNNFSIKRSFLNEVLKDIGSILTQAVATPIKNPDGTMSFKMSEIAPGSIYSYLNIQDGDLITGINGKKVQNVNEIMALFGKIKGIDQLQLTLERNDVEQNLEYDFVD